MMGKMKLPSSKETLSTVAESRSLELGAMYFIILRLESVYMVQGLSICQEDDCDKHL